MKRILIGRFVITALLATCGNGYLLGAVPDTALDRIIFSHQKHVTENEIDCNTCHLSVDSSLSASDRNFPNMDLCGECHDQVNDDAQCAMCHTNAAEPLALPNPERTFVFAHKSHIARGSECSACHESGKSGTGTMPIPAMAVCLDCHERKRADNRCAVCHENRVALVDIHPAEWRHQHGDRASSDQAYCRQCHRRDDFCLVCHRGDNTTAQVHDLNYQFTHALDAKTDESKCRSCHDFANFCIDCHLRQGRMPQSHSTLAWKSDHGPEARNDLQACAACHTGSDQTCSRIGCHNDLDGLRGTDPGIHEPGGQLGSEGGIWHSDNGVFCYDCHTNTHTRGQGFCGYCHE